MSNSVEYIYQVVDRFSRPLNKFQKMAERTAQKVSRLGKKMQDVGDKMQNVGNAIGGAAILGGMSAFVNQSVKVEDALADLVRVGDLTDQQLAKMEASMEALSEEIGVSKIGLLEQGFEGLKMGIPVERLDEFVRLAARTGVAFDISAKEAGNNLGSIRAKLGLTTESLGNLMDQTNLVADRFAADGSRMVNIIARTSGTMNSLQFPTHVIAGLAGFADQVETTSELAASGLNQIFARMAKNPRLVKKLMSDPVAALTEQFEKFAKIDPAKRFAVIEKRFGLEAARFMQKAVGRLDAFKETMAVASSDEAFGSMMREMANRAERTSTLFSILKNVVMNTFEALGDAIKPAVRALVDFAIPLGKTIKEFAKAHPVVIQVVAALGAFTAALTLVALPLGFVISMIGALLSPVILIIAAVSAVAAAFVYFYQTSQPVREMLNSIFDEVTRIFEPMGELFELMGLGGDTFDDMSGALEKIALGFKIALVPLKVFLQTLRTVVETAAALIDGDFGGALDALAGGAMDVLGTLGGGLSDAGSLLGITGGDEAAQTVATQRAAQVNNNVNVAGEVRVKAEPGTKVQQVDIGLNGGSNVAMAY